MNIDAHSPRNPRYAKFSLILANWEAKSPKNRQTSNPIVTMTTLTLRTCACEMKE